jgi:uncharacterized DUF497 family protein
LEETMISSVPLKSRSLSRHIIFRLEHDWMDFEWDDSKRQLNIEKHKIDFADAAGVFDDIVYTVPDERKDYGEYRFIPIGLMRGIEVVVVYTVRMGY